MKRYQSTEYLLTLGMAFTSDKRAMERRVRGVFARKKSAKSALVLSLALMLALAGAAFTTACQPETKQQAQLSADSLLFEQLGVPQHWTWNTASGDGVFTFTADLDLTLPNVSKVPVARASIREFTEGDLKKVARVLFGEDAAFTCPEALTQEGIASTLEQYRTLLDEAEAEDEPNEKQINGLTTMCQNYESLLQSAPLAENQEALPLVFSNQIGMTGELLQQGFTGDIEKDGYSFELIAANEPASAEGYYGETNYIYATMGEYGYSEYCGTIKDAPDGVTITQEQAVTQAKAIAAQLTDELQFCFCAPVHGNKANDRAEGWACVFMRVINGFPSAYVSAEVNGNILYDVPFAQSYECMTIVMDDYGMADFQWVNPMTVTQVQQDDAQLLSFDQIVQALPYQFRLKYISETSDSDTEHTVEITDVTLGLMRVGASGTGSFSYEPVWNFFYRYADVSYDTDFADKQDALFAEYPQATGALTISALDGRQIDRNTGY